jgi:mannose-1-phosphate guanylyltransferase/mannose-6-phosphate isomerase
VLVITPADQTVTNPAAFTAALERAVQEAAQGAVMILGVTPDRPETGYGYIQGGDLAPPAQRRTQAARAPRRTCR